MPYEENDGRSFPETNSNIDYTPDESGTGYIPDSASVGCGDEPASGRMSPFSNGEFPTSESGEGRNGG